MTVLCANQDYIVERIQQIPGMGLSQKPAGAFYVMPDVSAFFGPGVEAAGFGPVPDADALCRWVPRPSLHPSVPLRIEAPSLWEHPPHSHKETHSYSRWMGPPQRCFLPVCRAQVPSLSQPPVICRYLIEHALVALVPGDAFGAPDCLRISYAASLDTIKQAMDRVEAALQPASLTRGQ